MMLGILSICLDMDMRGREIKIECIGYELLMIILLEENR